MGLAPYGEPIYADIIKKAHRIREDGSFHLDMSYFGYLNDLKMTNDRFAALFGGPARAPETPIGKREMDLARSIQVVTEEIMQKIARFARAITGKKNLCLAGGVALNCVSNGKLVRTGLFDDVWVQPAAGDAGGSLGAALYAWYRVQGKPRKTDGRRDAMKGGFLGPGFDRDQVKRFLDLNALPYTELADGERNPLLAKALADEKVVGLLQGRMEFGPRALGGRSIIADARSVKMQSFLNLATKFRESFRPFAPIVLKEDAPEYFEVVHESPYMLMVDQVRKERCLPPPEEEDQGRRGHRPQGVGQHAAVRRAGHHPRRLFGADPDRRPGAQPQAVRPAAGLQEGDGLRHPGQHELQRPQRAHRVHARGRLSLLHAHRDRHPGARQLRPAKERTARVEGEHATGKSSSGSTRIPRS